MNKRKGYLIRKHKRLRMRCEGLNEDKVMRLSERQARRIDCYERGGVYSISKSAILLRHLLSVGQFQPSAQSYMCFTHFQTRHLSASVNTLLSISR